MLNHKRKQAAVRTTLFPRGIVGLLWAPITIRNQICDRDRLFFPATLSNVMINKQFRISYT